MATSAQIVEATARSFGITLERLLKEERRHHERHIVRYLTYELTHETAGKRRPAPARGFHRVTMAVFDGLSELSLMLNPPCVDAPSGAVEMQSWRALQKLPLAKRRVARARGRGRDLRRRRGLRRSGRLIGHRRSGAFSSEDAPIVPGC